MPELHSIKVNYLKFLFILSIALLLQGCMLTGKMTKLVSEYYAPKKSLRVNDNTNWLIIKTDSLPRVNGYCQTRYNRFFTVPLIIYTYSAENIECKVNPKMYVNSIVAEINRLSQSTSTNKLLSGKIIELSVNNIPMVFNHNYDNHYVSLQFFFQNIGLSITKNELFYKKNSLRVSYKIQDAATLTLLKQGYLSEPFSGAYYLKNYGQRRKNFVKDFIAAYDNDLENACKMIALNLINQLE